MASLFVLSLSLTGVPANGLAASQANLAMGYTGIVPNSNQQDLKFTVYNDGLGRTPATRATFQMVKPSPGPTVSQAVPGLDQNGSFDLVYHLAAPCAPGTVVLASVALANAANPTEATLLANPCSPDLRVDIVGFAAGSLSNVQLDVKNAGPIRTNGAKATVQTIQPGPANLMSVDVPPLNPGEDFPLLYTLGGTANIQCDGHSIKAQVILDGDVDPSNNVAESTLCAPKPPPPTPTPVPAPVPQAAAVYKQPGTHTLSLQPSYSESRYHTHHSGVGGRCLNILPEAALGGDFQGEVGWMQCDGAFGSEWDVYQTAVQFDFRQLDDIPAKLFVSASLTFTESPDTWRDGDGRPVGPAQQVFGCVTVLGFATTDWANRPPDDLYPNETYLNVVSNTTNFDVSQPVGDRVNRRDGSLQNGFVLRGVYEDPDGSNSSACLSGISQTRLNVTYVVPDQH